MANQGWYDTNKTDAAVELVRKELDGATYNFGPFASAHEGFAVIYEEVDELWDEVKNNKHGDPEAMKKEAKQVAAMAIRFMLDIDNLNMGKEVTRGD